MKKLLLLSAAAIMAAGAQAADVQQPVVMQKTAIKHISSNGRYAASSLIGSVTVYDLKTNSEKTFSGDENGTYALGTPGTSISDNGIFVGSLSESEGAYLDFSTGKWTKLPTSTRGDFGAFAITPDGSMIVGFIGNKSENIIANEEDNTYSIPVYWTRQSDGTFGNPVELPYPELDFTNRRPQLVLAEAVSADGNGIIGQMFDGFGGQAEPVYWTKKNDKWECIVLGEKLLNPNDVKFPKYFTAPEFDFADYMTQEELDAYAQAYTAWADGGYQGEAPNQEDYMNDAAKEAYAKYLAEYQKYNEMFEEWYAAYSDCLDNSPNYTEYTLAFNGTTAVFNSIALIPTDDPNAFMPFEEVPQIVAFNVNTGDHKFYLEGGAYATGVSANGDILCYTGEDNLFADKEAYIILSGKDTVTSIAEYLKTVNEEYPDWIKENMTHEIKEEVYNPDTENYDWVTSEKTITGEPNAPASFNVIALTNRASWDEEAEYTDFYSYLLPLDLQLEIESISANHAALEMSALRGGIVRLAGEAKSLRVYDLQGRMMFETLAPAAEVSTGLTDGIFIVKAEAADGSETVAKAIF